MIGSGTRGSFVARIWLEGEPDERPVWRGHVRHVQGKREKYFQNLSELEEFLESVTGVPPLSKSPDLRPGGVKQAKLKGKGNGARTVKA